MRYVEFSDLAKNHQLIYCKFDAINKLVTEELKLQLFEQKQKFLREIPHPKLILKEIKKLEQLLSLQEKNQLNYSVVVLTEEVLMQELVVFLEGYISDQLQLKHKVSIAQSASELYAVLTSLYQFQVALLKKLQCYVPQKVMIDDKEIKMSNSIDAYNILKRIRELNLKEKEIKDYLCDVIKAQKKPFDTLVENCLRANKIISHA